MNLAAENQVDPPDTYKKCAKKWKEQWLRAAGIENTLRRGLRQCKLESDIKSFTFYCRGADPALMEVSNFKLTDSIAWWIKDWFGA